jgi:hypothetical protein
MILQFLTLCEDVIGETNEQELALRRCVEHEHGRGRVPDQRTSDTGLLPLFAPYARFHQIAADPATLAHELGLAADDPVDIAPCCAPPGNWAQGQLPHHA